MKSPHSLVAEQAVLAAMILKPIAIESMAASLPDVTCFYDRRHRSIFDVIKTMSKSNMELDPVTITAEIVRMDYLGEFRTEIQARDYIEEICRHVPGTRNRMEYVSQVRKAWERRKIMDVSFQIAELASLPHERVEEVLQEMHNKSLDLMSLSEARGTVTYGQAAEAVFEDAYQSYTDAQDSDGLVIAGLPTGIPNVDEILGGYMPASFNIIGAEPGWGKTSLMMQSANQVAVTAPARYNGDQYAGGALVMSLEMTAKELASKILYAESELDSRKVETGDIEESQLGTLEDNYMAGRERRVFIQDLDRPTWAQLRSRIFLAHQELGVEIVYIDYLQIIEKPPRVDMKDHMKDIAVQCKALAKMLDIPIVGMAQLKRTSGRSKKPGRPKRTDLAESSYLERTADTIMLMWPRREYIQRKMIGWVPDPNPQKRERYVVIVDKNRRGTEGDASLVFNLTYGRFEPPPTPAEMEWVTADQFQSFYEKDDNDNTKEKTKAEKDAESTFPSETDGSVNPSDGFTEDPETSKE